MKNCVIQDWVLALPLMQQTVLLAAIRGPDGVAKEHPAKRLLRWYRRCLLKDSITKQAILDVYVLGGGSFMGPCPANTTKASLADDYIDTLDEIPHHYHLHFMHAVEIMGYKHSCPDQRLWWHRLYLYMADDMHLTAETEAHLDRRLCH